MLKRLVFLLFGILPVWLSGQSVFDSTRVASTTEVYFATASYEISPEANHVLDTLVASFGQTKRALRILITAHTDSVGTAAKNLLLSQNRAEAVRAALSERGLGAGKVEVAGMGARQPIADNATEAGRQRNRRATVQIIYSIPMADFSGRIKDKKTGAGIPAMVLFTLKDMQDSVRTDSSGRYSARLPDHSVVKLDVIAPNYFFESSMHKVYGSPAMVKAMKESGDIALTPAKAGEKATLKNLYFEGDKAILLKTSEPVLPVILRFMQVNPNLKVEIGGHVNPRINRGPAPGTSDHPKIITKPATQADKDFENDLSLRRAKLVYDYLIEHGIRSEQLTYKGYGRTQVIYSNPDNETQAEANRRVEVRVLEDNVGKNQGKQ
jgi:outer membrane protein OmpA-like peptidoglycan-associated protein